MKKNIKKKLLIIFLIPLTFGFLYIGFFFCFFPEEGITITGDKSFLGAQVYANDKLVAIMTLDDKENTTYARDIRSINGSILYKLVIKHQVKNKDNYTRPNISNTLDFKVITKDNKVYTYHAYNGEDLAYSEYPLKNFRRIK